MLISGVYFAQRCVKSVPQNVISIQQNIASDVQKNAEDVLKNAIKWQLLNKSDKPKITEL